jgi:hypothetical protein
VLMIVLKRHSIAVEGLPHIPASSWLDAFALNLVDVQWYVLLPWNTLCVVSYLMKVGSMLMQPCEEQDALAHLLSCFLVHTRRPAGQFTAQEADEMTRNVELNKNTQRAYDQKLKSAQVGVRDYCMASDICI